MEAQIIEGTLADIQRQLFAMHLDPQARLRIIVTESETYLESEEDSLRNAPRRNGLILGPTKDVRSKITTELIDELAED